MDNSLLSHSWHWYIMLRHLLIQKTNYPCEIGKCIIHGSYGYTLVLVTSLDLAYLKINLWFPILYVSLFFFVDFKFLVLIKTGDHVLEHLGHTLIIETSGKEKLPNGLSHQGETPVDWNRGLVSPLSLGIFRWLRARDFGFGGRAKKLYILRVSISTSSQIPCCDSPHVQAIVDRVTSPSPPRCCCLEQGFLEQAQVGPE